MRRPAKTLPGSLRLTLARALVPLLLPGVTAWLAAQERRILAEGTPLDATGLADAWALGIVDPGRVRVLAVPQVPLPLPRWVRALGARTGWLPDGTTGLCARYGIYVRRPYEGDRRLLAHELTHVRQYERLGGIRAFLRRYLHECLTAGYAAAPLEWECIEAAETRCRG